MSISKSLRKKLEQRRKDIETRSAGGQFFTIKEGVTRMRILPIKDEQDWGVEVIFFYLGKKVGGVVSPATFGKFCPVMKLHEELSKSKKESDREFAKTFRPTKKYLVPSIRYKDTKGKEVDDEAGIKLLLLSGGQYNEVLDFFLDEDDAGDFTDEKNGYDIKFKRVGKGMKDTKYTQSRCDRSPLPKKFRGTICDPEEMVKAIIFTKDELKGKIKEFLSAPNDDEPTSKKSSKKKKRSKEI